MEKPMLLAREDFINKLTILINESKLPAIILEPVLENVLSQTKVAINQQYIKEKEEYEKSISDIEKNKNE